MPYLPHLEGSAQKKCFQPENLAPLLSSFRERQKNMKQTAFPIATWPRLLDIHLAAAYSSVGARTIEDWIHDGLLEPVRMPGSTLKDKAGNIIAPAGRRRIAKILIDRTDLDRLIDERKRVSS